MKETQEAVSDKRKSKLMEYYQIGRKQTRNHLSALWSIKNYLTVILKYKESPENSPSG